MIWIAGSPSPHGNAGRSTKPRALGSPGLQARGSLLIELRSALPSRATKLYQSANESSRPGDLSIHTDGAGQILAQVETDHAPVRAEIPLVGIDASRNLRIQVSWDAGTADLWVGAPSLDFIVRHAPLAVAPRIDLDALTAWIDETPASCDIAFAALSDDVQPVGPMPGLAAGTLVTTPSGPVPIETLARGDIVIADQSDGTTTTVPVLEAVRCTLPARGTFQPVRLFAPSFGLRSDLILNANQVLSLSGPDVEYLFSQERVLALAGHLVSPRTGRIVTSGDTVVWHHLLLPGNSNLKVGNCSIVALRAGRLRRHPIAHAHSLLADLQRRDLPHPTAVSQQVLSEFETRTLLDQLSFGSS